MVGVWCCGVYFGEAQVSALWQHGRFFKNLEAGIARIYPQVDNVHKRKGRRTLFKFERF